MTDKGSYLLTGRSLNNGFIIIPKSDQFILHSVPTKRFVIFNPRKTIYAIKFEESIESQEVSRKIPFLL